MARPRLRLLLACCLPLCLWAAVPSALAGGANAPTAAETVLDDPALDPGTGVSLDLGGAGSDAVRLVSGSLPLSGTEPGLHTLYVRVQDQAGRWASPLGQSVWTLAGTPDLPLPPGSQNTLPTAEAFIDRDPGEGRATALVATDGGLDSSLESVLGRLGLAGRTVGVHTLYVRARDATGHWSAPLAQSFHLVSGTGTLPPAGGNAITAAEAFIDWDPGQGRGLALTTAADGAIDSAMEALRGTSVLAGLVRGPHVLNVRFRDATGTWSAPVRQSFFVYSGSGGGTPGGGAPRLVAAEGRIDGGAAVALPADDGAFDGAVETAHIAAPGGEDSHSVAIRFQDSRGLWSETISAGSGCTGGIPLSGRLTDATTGRALARVTVSAGGQSVTTAADGSFSIEVLSCGPQVVSVAVPGYAAYQRQFDPATGGWLEARLTRPATANGLSAQSGFASDPVNTATGNYVYEHKDLEIPGPGLPFRFTRAYNSREASASGTPGTPLGYGWTHGYRITLTRTADSVTILWGDGHSTTFAADGSGGYVPQYGVFDSLARHADGSFSLVKRDLTHYEFNATGRLTAIADRNDNTLTLTYTGANLTGIVDTAGRAIAFAYNVAGRLIRVTDPIGRTLRFTYDGHGDLISAEDPNGNLTAYGYDGNHQIVTVTDPRGHRIVNNTYDARRRVVSYQTDAKGGATSYSYEDTDRVTTITDAMGGVTVHYHDDLLRLVRARDPAGAESLYVYDAAGNRVQVVDKRGNLTEYGYDERGNVTSQRDALGGVTAITYDDQNNPLTRTDALGNTTRFEYDGRGNRIATFAPDGGAETLTYSVAGLPLTSTDGLGHVTASAYDAQGNLTAVMDAEGNQTRYTYDGVARLLNRTDAMGRTTAFAYDAVGNLLILTDPAGNRVRYTCDANGNRTAVTDRLGFTTAFAYDEKDLLVSVTDPLGGVITSSYDALDRKIGSRDRNGHLRQTAYDAVGNPVRLTDALARVTTSTFDPQGNRTSVTDPLGQVRGLAYDALNRLVTETDPLGHVTATDYDALDRVTARTDANGQTTRLRYDAAGRLVEVTDAAGGILQYAYDLAGHRVSMRNPLGQVTRYQYDALNRLIAKVEPLGNTTRYAYDAVGNLVRLTKPDGTVIAYTYDTRDRLTRLTNPGGSVVSFAYDAEGHRTGMQDALGTSSFAYDARGRLTRYTDPRGNRVDYGYDAEGNRTRLTYPGAGNVTYAYDAADRMSTVTDWLGRTTRYGYDAAGRLVETQNPNGTRALYGYDAAGRLTTLVNRGADGGTIAGYAYTLDALGNHLAEDRDEPLFPRLTAHADRYAYDAEDRLTAENGTANTFDANGNQTRQGSDRFDFDHQDRLVEASVGGFLSTYAYDGLGNRLARVQGGSMTRSVVDPSGSLTWVLAESDAAKAVRARYVYGLGLVSRIAADGATHWYHSDSRGSTVALSDTSGAVTDRYAYDPFGAAGAVSGMTVNPFRYIGRHGVMDEGNGLLHVRARYYQPATGRFLAKDPRPGNAGESQSLNRYIYALSNPLRLMDISGLSALEGMPYWGSASNHGGYCSAKSSDASHENLLVGVYRSTGDFVSRIDVKKAGTGLASMYVGFVEVVIGAGKAAPGVTIASGGVAACSSIAACVAGVPMVAYGVALAAPGVATATLGVNTMAYGFGDMIEGVFQVENPFDGAVVERLNGFSDGMQFSNFSFAD